MIIAAFLGAGKTTFAKLYPHRMVDFFAMPNQCLDNYVEAIKVASNEAMREEKILLIPTAAHVLKRLRKENIDYSLYYPHRDAKKAYRERYIKHGIFDALADNYDNWWDKCLNLLENDPCEWRTVLKPHEYLSDIIGLLDITIIDSALGCDVYITNGLAEDCLDEDDKEELSFTFSIGPKSDEDIKLGSKLSDVPKYFSNGPEPPDDEKYINFCQMKQSSMITNLDALATFSRLGLLDKFLRIPDWKGRTADEVMAFLQNRKIGTLRFYSLTYDVPEGVRKIWHDSFRNAHKLSNIKIPDSVSFIGNNAFEGCVNLTGITTPIATFNDNCTWMCIECDAEYSEN